MINEILFEAAIIGCCFGGPSLGICRGFAIRNRCGMPFSASVT